MSQHLDKAKGALVAARELLERCHVDNHGLLNLRDAEEFSRTIAVATAQAHIASAEALHRIADLIETRLHAASEVV